MQRVIVSAVFGALAITAVQAQNIGDLRQGRRLALDVCASCHAVRAGQTRSPVCTENPVRVYRMIESAKLAR